MASFDCADDDWKWRALRYAQHCCVKAVEYGMLALGPCLIVTVLVLVAVEIYWFLALILPRSCEIFSPRWWAHAAWILFLAFNGLFNYASCVLTDPGAHGSRLYRELVAAAAEDGTLARAESGDAGASWLERGPYDWGYDRRSGGPKAPRSHYDHVTKKLVLNMDHYCPWMFNCVGFANYRYFVLFLFYVTTACLYGVAVTARDFLGMAGIRWGGAFRGPRLDAPTHTAVMFTFVLALSVGCAVALLFGWHVYLLLTAQTTIEFYGNYTLRLRAAARGQTYRNPYSRGAEANWRQLFGPGDKILALLPSSRPPPGKPWPDPVRRAVVATV